MSDEGAARDAKRPSTQKWWAIGGIGAIAALAVVAAVVTGSGPDSPDAPTALEARNQCQEWAKERLKSPSTADFSGVTEESTGEGSWTISGDVDSENGFGASIRSTWTCNIRLDGDTWRGSAAVS